MSKKQEIKINARRNKVLLYAAQQITNGAWLINTNRIPVTITGSKTAQQCLTADRPFYASFGKVYDGYPDNARLATVINDFSRQDFLPVCDTHWMYHVERKNKTLHIFKSGETLISIDEAYYTMIQPIITDPQYDLVGISYEDTIVIGIINEHNELLMIIMPIVNTQLNKEILNEA